MSGCDVCAGGRGQGFRGARSWNQKLTVGRQIGRDFLSTQRPGSVPDFPSLVVCPWLPRSSLSLSFLHPLGKAALAPLHPGAPTHASPPFSCPQIVSSASTDLQDYTYYFVPAPWLSVKLLRLLQCYPPPGTAEPGLGPGPLTP